jgi:hypothetical protein
MFMMSLKVIYKLIETAALELRQHIHSDADKRNMDADIRSQHS